MKKLFKKSLAALLTVAVLCAAMAAVPFVASAKTQPALRIVTTSNIFGSAKANYYTLEEDDNGDSFITVKYMLYAEGSRVVNCDIDEITWDPAVLEMKKEYNMVKIGRTNMFNLFSGSVEQMAGAGMTNITAPGRVIGNFTNISSPMYAYHADNTPVTFITVRFKVLDKNAGETVINCRMESIGMCNENTDPPLVEYGPIRNQIINQEVLDSITAYTVIEPEGQTLPIGESERGDVNGDSDIDINDATEIQKVITEFTDADGNPLYDLEDPKVFDIMDVYRDGIINIRDVTEIQRFIAEFISEFME